MITVIIVSIILLTAIILFIRKQYRRTKNKTRIKYLSKIRSLTDKDKTVYIVIDALEGWQVYLHITPGTTLYTTEISYNGMRPTAQDLKHLYLELTKESSVVTVAHNLGITVLEYLEKRERYIDKNNRPKAKSMEDVEYIIKEMNYNMALEISLLRYKKIFKKTY